MEDLIKAKVVFDTGGIGGAMSGGGGSAGGSSGSGATGIGKAMTFAVTLPITDVLHDIYGGIKSLAQFSPILNAEFIRMRKGLQLFLMPIGTVITEHLKPFTDQWMSSAKLFYDQWKEEGSLPSALAAAMADFFTGIGWLDEEGKINFEGVIDNLDEITEIAAVLMLSTAAIIGGITIASLIMGSIGGFTLGTAGALAVGAVLLILAANMTEGGLELLIADMGTVGVAYGLLAGNPYVLIASALVFTWAVWGDEISEWLIGEAEELGKLFSEAFWGVFGSEGFFAKNIDETFGAAMDWIFGRDEKVTAVADLEEDAFTLGEQIEGLDPIWTRVWNSIKDTFTDNVKPTFEGIDTQLTQNISNVNILDSTVRALPNISRTITYYIQYVEED